MAGFTLELVTLDGVKFAEEVFEVQLPTSTGTIGVFPHHMPLVSMAAPGVLSVRRQPQEPDNQMLHFAIDGGVIEVTDKRLRVLVDSAHQPHEIVVAEVQAALKHAQEMAKSAKDEVTISRAQSLIEQQQVRLKLAELKRHGSKQRHIETIS